MVQLVQLAHQGGVGFGGSAVQVQPPLEKSAHLGGRQPPFPGQKADLLQQAHNAA